MEAHNKTPKIPTSKWWI